MTKTQAAKMNPKARRTAITAYLKSLGFTVNKVSLGSYGVTTYGETYVPNLSAQAYKEMVAALLDQGFFLEWANAGRSCEIYDCKELVDGVTYRRMVRVSRYGNFTAVVVLQEIVG